MDGVKLILLQNYGMLQAGEEITVDKPVADLLLGRGVAQKAVTKKKKVTKKKGINHGNTNQA